MNSNIWELVKRLFRWLFRGEAEKTLVKHLEKVTETLKRPEIADCYYRKIKKGKKRYTLRFEVFTDGIIKRTNLGWH